MSFKLVSKKLAWMALRAWCSINLVFEQTHRFLVVQPLHCLTSLIAANLPVVHTESGWTAVFFPAKWWCLASPLNPQRWFKNAHNQMPQLGKHPNYHPTVYSLRQFLIKLVTQALWVQNWRMAQPGTTSEYYSCYYCSCYCCYGQVMMLLFQDQASTSLHNLVVGESIPRPPEPGQNSIAWANAATWESRLVANESVQMKQEGNFKEPIYKMATN